MKLWPRVLVSCFFDSRYSYFWNAAVQEHYVLVSSSLNRFAAWTVSKFDAYHQSVDRIASVAFNTDTKMLAVVFETTGKVSMFVFLSSSCAHNSLMSIIPRMFVIIYCYICQCQCEFSCEHWELLAHLINMPSR